MIETTVKKFIKEIINAILNSKNQIKILLLSVLINIFKSILPEPFNIILLHLTKSISNELINTLNLITIPIMEFLVFLSIMGFILSIVLIKLPCVWYWQKKRSGILGQYNHPYNERDIYYKFFYRMCITSFNLSIIILSFHSIFIDNYISYYFHYLNKLNSLKSMPIFACQLSGLFMYAHRLISFIFGKELKDLISIENNA